MVAPWVRINASKMKIGIGRGAVCNLNAILIDGYNN